MVYVSFSFTTSCLVIVKTIYLAIDDYPKKSRTMLMCRDQNVKTNYRQNKNKKFVHIWDMSGTFLLPVKIGSGDINDK